MRVREGRVIASLQRSLRRHRGKAKAVAQSRVVKALVASKKAQSKESSVNVGTEVGCSPFASHQVPTASCKKEEEDQEEEKYEENDTIECYYDDNLDINLQQLNEPSALAQRRPLHVTIEDTPTPPRPLPTAPLPHPLPTFLRPM